MLIITWADNNILVFILFRHYVDNNISVVVYPVNTRMFYSYCWCSGATWVTTDVPQNLADIQKPIIMVRECRHIIAHWLIMYNLREGYTVEYVFSIPSRAALLMYEISAIIVSILLQNLLCIISLRGT